MDLVVVARGFILGFSIAAVLGPIGVLCVRRTLAGGFVVGFVSGLGAATADATYASLAAFSVSALAALLIDQQRWLQLVGGVFLICLGARTLRTAPASQAAVAVSLSGVLGTYLSTLALTLANPMTVLSFVGIFAALGLGVVGGTAAGVLLVLGVFAGSAVWWLVLAGGVAALRTRLTRRVFRMVNLASGLVILGFGAQTLLRVWSS
jgi:threonine/homoserine/homoserine lactone efflux protein